MILRLKAYAGVFLREGTCKAGSFTLVTDVSDMSEQRGQALAYLTAPHTGSRVMAASETPVAGCTLIL